MRRRDTAIALILALACHAALFALAPPFFQEARILLQSGVCGVDVWLVPSPESPGAAEEGVIAPEPVGEEPPRPPQARRGDLLETVVLERDPDDASEQGPEDAHEEGPPESPEAAPAGDTVADVPPEDVEESEPEGEAEPQSGEPVVESHAADGSPRPRGTAAKAVGLLVPRYPFASRVNGEEGRVVISVTILADGTAAAEEVIESSGCRRLDRAALEAVRKASFVPAMRGGVSVESRRKFAFNFKLEAAKTRGR